MSEMYAYCDKQAKRIVKLIQDMEEAEPQRREELQRAKVKLANELRALCQQNNVDFFKILQQNELIIKK